MRSAAEIFDPKDLFQHQYAPVPGNHNDSASRQATAQHVNMIFSELLQAFPAWNSRFERKPQELSELKRSYLKGLVENQLNDLRLIQFGIRKARAVDSDFFPSVGRFIRLCRPTATDLNLPTAEKAFAMIGDYHYPETRRNLPAVVQATFNQIGNWELTHQSEQKLFPVFKSHYDALIRKLALGEDISGFCPKALPKPEARTVTKAQLETRRQRGLTTIQQLRQKHFGRK